MRWRTVCVFVCLLILCPSAARAEPAETFRPPAIPLVTHDPYFSVWSMSDRLTDDWPKHWTGTVQALCGMARIDGKPYRFLASPLNRVPAMKQVSVEVLPTRTLYQFEAGGGRPTLTFPSPLLPPKLDIFLRPL